MAGARLLSGTLRAGAAWDAGAAALILLAPGALSRTLAIALPELIWPRLLAVVLLMLAAFYLWGAAAPDRARGVGTIAAGGRLAGGALLVAHAASGGGGGWLLLGAADLAFAALHLAGLKQSAGAADPV